MTDDEQPTDENAEAPTRKAPLPDRSFIPAKLPEVTKKRRLTADDPSSYKGGRYVRRNTLCGWCMDGIHGNNCKHEVAYFDRLYVCKCECNKDWIPQDLGTGELKEAVRKPIVVNADDDEEPEETQEESAETPEHKVKKIRRKTSS